MKSTVCKKANELIKKGYDRSYAFKKAWATVKYEANCIKASDIKEGDYIRTEYGDWGNFVKCTVTSKSNELFLDKYYVIKGISKEGLEVEFCARPDELLEKAA